MTLIAVLRTIAYGWNQKNLADSARKISEAGKLLYQRLAVMAGHFEDLGKKLGGAVESYNKSVGSMERVGVSRWRASCRNWTARWPPQTCLT